ncbi:unnamed protein product [Arabis nemorensis]|uniref:Uncharacterized protein n=1 Tax=Arabis nemorensis TaxID=586526 RepID=A0A565BJ65_9BRAS|nr:unnamed protein product [Arabis nemorensis]
MAPSPFGSGIETLSRLHVRRLRRPISTPPPQLFVLACSPNRYLAGQDPRGKGGDKYQKPSFPSLLSAAARSGSLMKSAAVTYPLRYNTDGSWAWASRRMGL